MRITRFIAAVCAVCTAAAMGITQSDADPRPATPSKPTASDPTPSGNDGGEASRQRQESNRDSGASAESQRIVVVVSNKNPLETLKIEELRRIFLRKKTQWKNGTGITVYERSVDHEVRHEFSNRVLKKKPSELTEYWMNLQMTRGLKPPKVLRSSELVKRYLQRVRGGIAYLYESEVDGTVKAVTIKDHQSG